MIVIFSRSNFRVRGSNDKQTKRVEKHGAVRIQRTSLSGFWPYKNPNPKKDYAGKRDQDFRPRGWLRTADRPDQHDRLYCRKARQSMVDVPGRPRKGWPRFLQRIAAGRGSIGSHRMDTDARSW